MKPLAPNLFDRRFKDLMEIGRARLPELAPEWTDHNAHDPGITLMELLAWNSEAQMYALARMRSDERDAYAGLLGLKRRGTRPARGLIWSDPKDQRAPVRTFAESVVIPADAVVRVLGTDAPTYRPAREILWVPGRIESLITRLPGGRQLVHTAVNARGGPPFLPFGESAGRREVLELRYVCGGNPGLFPRRRELGRSALWAIGVRADATQGTAAGKRPEESDPPSPLAAVIVVAGERFPLRIETDTTAGLLRTGYLLLDLSEVEGSPTEFTLELQAPRGSDRPPRLSRIEPSVLPIEQGSFETEEHAAHGLPDLSLDLAFHDLQFESEDDAVGVEVDEIGSRQAWKRCKRLADKGPEDRVFELDAAAQRITFGNGVNGRMPAEGETVRLRYRVCDGEAGGVARNRGWSVAGFSGAFGRNPDAIDCGSNRIRPAELRRDARLRAREVHALVSSADLVAAALALSLLEVARAWVVPLAANAARDGRVTLVAMLARPNGKEPVEVPETARWLEAVRRRLVARMQLGSRLVVAAPIYREFFVHAKLEAEQGRDPKVVEAKALETLQQRLALVSSPKSPEPRAPGVPVARNDVSAWLRAVEGVGRVVSVELVAAKGEKPDPDLTVPRGGLPRLDSGRTRVAVKRPTQGSAS